MQIMEKRGEIIFVFLPLFHLESTSKSSFVPSGFVNLSKNANGVLGVKNVSLTPTFNFNKSYSLFSGSA